MTRIANRNLEQLKRSISIKSLAESYGVKLKRHGGSDFIGQCPLADHAGGDRTASFVVSPKKNLWNCLGHCGRGGSVIDLVMAMEGLSFVSAWKKLEAQLAGAPSTAVPAVVEAVDELSRDEEDLALLSRVVVHYHAKLKEMPKALDYLTTRGIASPAALERFRLGYSDNSFVATLPARSTAEGKEARRRLLRLGVVNERGAETLYGSLVIPIFGERGEVLDLYGRSTRGTLSAKHRYLPGPHRGVFNLEAFRGGDEVILCEALIDALTFWCAGFTNVSSSFGTSGFTAQHLEVMKTYGTKRVLIAYDRDAAGDAAAVKLAKKLSSEIGVACWRVEFAKGHDANSQALAVRPAEKSLGLALSRARFMGKGAEPDRPRTAELAFPGASAVSTPPAMLASSTPLAAPAASPPVEPPSPPASASSPVAPASPTAIEDIAAEVTEDEIRFAFGDRRYRARGFARNTSVDVLKVNLLVSRKETFFVDTLDLYAARARASFISLAAKEIEVEEDVLKSDVGRVLLKMEALQDARLRGLVEPKSKTVVLTPAEEAAALELLRDPKLVERILGDFERCGVVGEKVNKLTGYLAAVSRKLDDPLAIIIQSSSAAGKTSLMEAVLAFIPPEEREKYSAMTGQSLFYMGETSLKHKILAIVEEEGAERAAYALKLLQSEKELSIATTGKDPATGELRTKEYRIEGPVMIFLTTTAVEIDEELLNRCILLTVDEDRAQTRAIHKLQRRRETLEGSLEHHDRQKILKLHQNAQRMLRPLRVANPHAERLTFGDHQLRMRRDHMKYLCLIRSIALLHQYQRTLKQIHREDEVLDFIEVELSDIALANQIARRVLSRSLDELAPQTRRFLDALDRMVSAMESEQGVGRSDVRFSRRDVIERLGFSYEQLRVHLDRLVELEHVLVHLGRRGQSYTYELTYDGRGFGPEGLIGLTDLEGAGESLFVDYPEFGVPEAKFGGPLGAHWGAIGAPLGTPKSDEFVSGDAGLGRLQDNLRPESMAGASRFRGANGHANGHSRPLPRPRP